MASIVRAISGCPSQWSLQPRTLPKIAELAVRSSRLFSQTRFLSTSKEPIVSRFSPPAFLDDLSEREQDIWSAEHIDPMFENGKEGYTQRGDGTKVINNSPRPQFFNPRTTERASDLAEEKISWIAFPRIVKQNTSGDVARWREADRSRDVQDEYCEWSVTRNLENKITSVQFTCEGPEYWSFLGQTNPQKVLELYRKYISPEVEMNHLFQDGVYQPRNQWNNSTSKGAMHLIQINNSLAAEVELAAGASMVREIHGHLVEEQQALIKCGKYGQAQRNSDPHIGDRVNTYARNGAMVSLRDPVGLYFGDFNPIGWETPDNSKPESYWKLDRGTGDTFVRATYEVPEDKHFTVGDILINGRNIEYGGQIADYFEIKLVGIAQNIGKTPVESFGCVEYRGRVIEALSSPQSLRNTLGFVSRYDGES